MKAKHILSISLITILISCTHVPRGVDEAGVWGVRYFTDSFGDQTDEPFLVGIIDKGEYSGHEASFWRNADLSGEGKLELRYYFYRNQGGRTQSGKESVEDIPILEIKLTYREDAPDSSYYYSNLWEEFKYWDIKFETEGMTSFASQEHFSDDSYRRLILKGEDANRIMAILTNGTNVRFRAKCEDSNSYDMYSFTIESETLNDLQEVHKGYEYHYSEYLKQMEGMVKNSDKEKK